MFTSLQAKLIMLLAVISLSFFSGVKIANWRNDSVDLAAEKAAEKAATKFQGTQKDIATNVITSLNEWKSNNVQTNEKIIREKLQPVFYSQCVTPEYVSLFNQQTNSYKASGASQPATKGRD